MLDDHVIRYSWQKQSVIFLIKLVNIFVGNLRSLFNGLCGGVNVLYEFFKLDSKFNGRLSDNIFSFLDTNEIFKKNSILIADKGINFSTE